MCPQSGDAHVESSLLQNGADLETPKTCPSAGDGDGSPGTAQEWTRILGFSGKHSGALKRLKAREEPSMPQRQKPTWKGYASCRIPTTRPSGKGRAQSAEQRAVAASAARAEGGGCPGEAQSALMQENASV